MAGGTIIRREALRANLSQLRTRKIKRVELKTCLTLPIEQVLINSVNADCRIDRVFCKAILRPRALSLYCVTKVEAEY